jgi:hypothetical protein
VYETALLVTAFGLGLQVVFGAFFLALVTMRLAPSAGQGAGAPEREAAVVSRR